MFSRAVLGSVLHHSHGLQPKWAPGASHLLRTYASNHAVCVGKKTVACASSESVHVDKHITWHLRARRSEHKTWRYS
jgi:hypothetical protein